MQVAGYTLTGLHPWCSKVGLGWLCCPCIEWEPVKKISSCISSGNPYPQSSQLAEPLWTDPDLKSGIDVHKLISTQKKQRFVGSDLLNLSNSLYVRKKSSLLSEHCCFSQYWSASNRCQRKTPSPCSMTPTTLLWNMNWNPAITVRNQSMARMTRQG